MTIIVAARLANGHVCMAADSQTSIGWEKAEHDASKLWTAGQYAIGAAGDVRAAQVVRHFTTWPKFRPDEDTDTEAFLVKSIVPAIRAAVANTGVQVVNSSAESVRTTFAVCWAGTVAMVHGNYAVTIPRSGRLAIGSGSAEALGYLGESGPWTVKQVVEAARRATITADGCSGDIDHVVTGDLKLNRPSA